ncbi:MAG TPA: hypothetical protein VJH68_00880 [Candidatus Nanoarchaeia archaeon]|nr:hypothetical protein [Candidatus Nanoarchaeia archaeon]
MSKVKELDQLDKDAAEAVKWLAAEFKYATQLILELEQIRTETDSTKAEREAKSAISIFRWIGRGERRTDREERRVISGLQKLGRLLPPELRTKEEEFVRQLIIAEGMLVKFGSRYTSEVRNELKRIRKDEHLLKGLERHPEIIERVKDKLKKEIYTVEEGVKALKKWIESNQSILIGEIEPFVRKLQQLAA